MTWDAKDKLGHCQSLDEALECTVAALRIEAEAGLDIHYVAGAISADGEEFIERNLKILLEYREKVARELGSHVLVLTAPLVFTPDIYESLQVFTYERDERESRLQRFWDGIVSSGVVSGIHFAPGWERSTGARLEHEAAEKHGVNRFYISDSDQAG